MQTISNIFWGGVFLWAITILATAAVFNSTAFFFLVFLSVGLLCSSEYSWAVFTGLIAFAILSLGSV